MNKQYRNCPECGEEIPYSTKRTKIRAEKRNTNCKSCAQKEKNNPMYGKFGENNPNFGSKRSEESKKIMGDVNKGKKRSDETKQKMRKNHANVVGKNNPMYEKSAYDIWIKKYGKEETDKKWKERSKKISKTLTGKECSEEARKNMRISANKRIEKQYGQIMPNHSLRGCEMIRWYNMYYGFNFRHAENGGEVCIGGYWPDGLDEKRKTIIEIDEKHHFDNGNLRQKDIRRQKYLESLGYEFIRVRI